MDPGVELDGEPLLSYHGPRCGVGWRAFARATEGRVSPVSRGDAGLVLLGAGLVEHGQQLRGLVCQGLQVDDRVRAVPVVGVEDEVAVEVPGVQPGEGEAVAIASQGGLGGGQGGAGGRGEEVLEQMVSDVARNTSTLV